MNRTFGTVAAGFAFAVAVGALAGCSSMKKSSEAPGTDFRDFNKVTVRQYHTPEDAMAHKDTWHNIWVNDTGLDAYLSGASEVPVGTVVIKEDFVNADGEPGDFQKYLVMAKMGSGYDAENGDWYYSVRMPNDEPVDMNGMTMDGRVPMCIGCHAQVAETDYLFGPPDSVRVER